MALTITSRVLERNQESLAKQTMIIILYPSVLGHARNPCASYHFPSAQNLSNTSFPSSSPRIQSKPASNEVEITQTYASRSVECKVTVFFCSS